MPQAKETLEKVFREKYGRMIATLIRLSGSFDRIGGLNGTSEGP